jgi:uncharacterized membrane protein
METIYLVLRAVHIFFGMTALFVAPGAMAAIKGSLWHRRFGRVYFWSMASVAATAMVMTRIKPNLFLLMVALFSFYLAFSGYRALYHKRPQDRAGMLDWAGLSLMAAGSIGLLAWGALKLRTGADLGWVAIVFGLVGSTVAASDMRKFLVPASDRRAWLYRHMTGMLAAYIATVTAFSVVNFQFLPPLVRWLWSIALGVPAIVIWVAGYKRQARPVAAT